MGCITGRRKDAFGRRQSAVATVCKEDRRSYVGARSMANPLLTQPLVFEPIFMERVWGGRRLESLYGKRLPSAALIGEAWGIVDRPGAQSVVDGGPVRGP